jgi:lipopolysaccharide transport system ATP-binding protein
MPNALVADHVAKEYTIGALAYETMLREALVNLVRHPFRRQAKEDLRIWALKDVSFTVPKGSVVGIIGRNGAGKSTLLKILSRITHPTSGRIDVNGRVASLLEVGTGFHEELTGRENIFLNGSILGMKKREIDARLDEIIGFAGIHRFIDTPIKRYSSGMRLRLGFAVAAHLETDILLVDEVLAVGDVEFQKKCLSKIENLHQGGRTVLFVSHNMTAIEHLCSRTLWIHDGQLRMDGETNEVIRAYLANFGGNQSVGTSLADFTEREGTGEAQFTRIEFLDAGGQEMPVVRSGDEVTVRMHYRARNELRNAHFGITLVTELGTHVATLSTHNSGMEIPFLPPGDGYLDLTIEHLNLMPGRYWISLYATSPNHYNMGKYCWDVLEHCTTLEIEPSDFYKTGNGVGRQFGIVLLPCKWSLRGENESTDPVPDAEDARR